MRTGPHNEMQLVHSVLSQCVVKGLHVGFHLQVLLIRFGTYWFQYAGMKNNTGVWLVITQTVKVSLYRI